MPYINAHDFLTGKRFVRLSDQARLFFPLIYLASNGFGRTELDYQRFRAQCCIGLRKPPTEEEYAGIINEYRNELMFAYEDGEGGVWGQWHVSEKYLPRYKTSVDKQSPSPPYHAFSEWRDKTIKFALKVMPTAFSKMLGILPQAAGAVSEESAPVFEPSVQPESIERRPPAPDQPHLSFKPVRCEVAFPQEVPFAATFSKAFLPVAVNGGTYQSVSAHVFSSSQTGQGPTLVSNSSENQQVPLSATISEIPALFPKVSACSCSSRCRCRDLSFASDESSVAEKPTAADSLSPETKTLSPDQHVTVKPEVAIDTQRPTPKHPKKRNMPVSSIHDGEFLEFIQIWRKYDPALTEADEAASLSPFRALDQEQKRKAIAGVRLHGEDQSWTVTKSVPRNYLCKQVWLRLEGIEPKQPTPIASKPDDGLVIPKIRGGLEGKRLAEAEMAAWIAREEARMAAEKSEVDGNA